MRKFARYAASLFVMAALAACDINVQSTPVVMFPTAAPPGTVIPTFNPGGNPQPVVTSAFIPTPPPVIPTLPPVVQPTPLLPTAIPTLDNNWNVLPSGVQWRTLSYRSSRGADVGVLVVRADPSIVDFKVYYTPGQTKTIQQWQAAIPRAAAIINANFYDAANRALGLVAVDGVLYGSAALRSARDDGMFLVRSGQPRVRSMFLEPFNPTERFDQAVHAFPILMAGGFVAPINPDLAAVSDRRTVIAQDKFGRILFIITPFSQTTLGDLASWLGRSGLEISYALNMDGGNSTNMYLATGGPFQFTAGIKPIPVVVAMIPRS